MNKTSHLYDFVWVFMGDSAVQSSAVFATITSAEDWISRTQVSGMLTAYPLDTPVYDWAIDCKYFNPAKAYQKDPKFIGRFSSASLEHYHYADGIRCD